MASFPKVKTGIRKALDSSYGLTAPVLDTAPDANGTFTFPKPEGAPFFKVIGVRKF